MAFRTGIGIHLRAAYLSLHRAAQTHFARFGVTADQYVLMTFVADHPNIVQRELARKVHSDPNTVTAMLSRLEQRGLIRRRGHKDDGRVRCVSLTPKGRRLQARLEDSAEQIHRLLTEAVHPEEAERFLGALQRISETMSSYSRTPAGAKR